MKIIRYLCIVVSLVLLLNTVVYADDTSELEEKIKTWLNTGTDEWGSDEYTYRGPYDLSADHDVNYFTRNGGAEANLQIVYQYVLGWGVTRQAACGIAANLYYECLGDYTCVEDYVGWGRWMWYDPQRDSRVNPSWPYGHHGKRGLGMIGFTATCMQVALFNTAAAMGKQWTDLSVQLQLCKVYFVENDSNCGAKMRDPNETAASLAEYFCRYKVRPAHMEEAVRVRSAKAMEMFNDPVFQNLDPLSPESSSNPGDQPIVNLSTLSGMVSESELMGMPAQSGLAKDIKKLTFVDASSLHDYVAQQEIVRIREQMELKRSFDAWDTIRVVFVFIGLLLIMYAIVLFMAMMFDKVNVWFDISLVTLFSLGALHYTPDVDVLTNKRHFIGTRRMVITIVTIFLLGSLFVSGAVLPAMMKVLYELVSRVGGKI